MSSTIDQDTGNVSTSQSGMGGSLLKILSVLGPVGTVVGGAVNAYEFLKSLEDDPILTALGVVIQDLHKVMLDQDLDTLSGIRNDKVTPTATMLDAAIDTMKAFNNSDSVSDRNTLSNNFGQNGGLHLALLALFAGYQHQFIPVAYKVDGKIPAWTKGRNEKCWCYSGGFFLSNDNYQVYEQANQPLTQYWSVPGPLDQKNFERWDAGLYLPLHGKALQFWEMAMGLLEPFYRLTGKWAPHIATVVSYMDALEYHWSSSLLWTREMPTKSELKQNFGFFSEPNAKYYYSGTGFKKWPLGVVDPITGTERVNVNWWKNDQEDHVVELWTEEQRNKFVAQRNAERQKLEAQCGLVGFSLRKESVRALLIPPSYSPSMEPHPELLHSQYLSTGSPAVIGQGEQTTVTNKLGQVMSGHYARTPVIATAPFSVQSKPAPGGENRPRRAESDVEFGYQIRIIPKGGQPLQNPWIWHLRHNRDDPVSSLYHRADGEPRPIPDSTSKTFTTTADTWETITDGTYRDRRDMKSKSPIAFTMTVTIADMKPLEKMKPPLIQADVDNRTRRGALWITIEAGKDENDGRSFEVGVELTETAAVDPQGNIGKPAAENKKYTSTLTIPVDICRIYVPPAYFGTVEKDLGSLQTDSKALGIPRPEPDPDPILELSLWRIVLEREPALLQRYVHRRREATGRPALSAQQALAELDRILKHAAAQAVAPARAPE